MTQIVSTLFLSARLATIDPASASALTHATMQEMDMVAPILSKRYPGIQHFDTEQQRRIFFKSRIGFPVKGSRGHGNDDGYSFA